MAEDNGALYYAMGRDNSMNSGNSGNGFGMGGWGDLAALIVVAGLFGWGRGGFGGFGGGNGGGGIGENYVLATDFATIERKLDGVNSGICDSTFALNNTITNGFANAQNTLTQGFAGVNTALVQQGYESRLGTQALASDLAKCCCDIREGISGVNYNLATQANMISRGIENGFSQTNYNLATQNCQTLTAIDKLGDRIIGYMSNQETARLRDEVAQYRAHANSEYIINKLSPKCPEAAYIVQPPQQVTFPTNCCGTVNYASAGNGCGCC